MDTTKTDSKTNPVAKYARRFNRAAVHRDRKKESRKVRGSKHKRRTET
jgi:hypothetical protein